MKPQQRKTELVLVCGINGTGKTTWLHKNIVEGGGRCLVVTPDSYEWGDLADIPPQQLRTFTGAGRIVYEGPDNIERIRANYFGGALILDDAMAYLTSQTPEALQWIYTRHRQQGVDVFMVAHGLRQYPPRVFTFAQWLILFNTVENFSTRKKDVREDLYQKIITAQQRIAKKVAKGEPYYHEIILLDDQIRGKWS